MLKKVLRLFLLGILIAPCNGLWSADLPDQLHALQDKLNGLKGKLEGLRAALQDLRKNFEGGEGTEDEALVDELAKEKSFDDFLNKIRLHLGKIDFINNLKQAFNKLEYSAFKDFVSLFPKNQSNDELGVLKNVFVDVYGLYIDNDLKSKRFDLAAKKADDLRLFEESYRTAFLEENKKIILDKLAENSKHLNAEQLELILKELNRDYNRDFFAAVITKALTSNFLSLGDQKKLVEELIKSISVGSIADQISKRKEIIGNDRLKPFYEQHVKSLLMNGLSNVDAYIVANKSTSYKSVIMYGSLRLITDKVAKVLFSDVENFNDLKASLKDGANKVYFGMNSLKDLSLLSPEQIKKRSEYIRNIPVDEIPCEAFCNAFLEEKKYFNELNGYLKHLLIHSKNNVLSLKNKPLSNRLIKEAIENISSSSGDEWGSDDEDNLFEFPDWFTLLKIDEDKKQDILRTMLVSFLRKKNATIDEFELLKKHFDILEKLDSAIKNIIFADGLEEKFKDFWTFFGNKELVVADWISKIGTQQRAYDEDQAKEAA